LVWHRLRRGRSAAGDDDETHRLPPFYAAKILPGLGYARPAVIHGFLGDEQQQRAALLRPAPIASFSKPGNGGQCGVSRSA